MNQAFAYDDEAAWQIALAELAPAERPQNWMEELRMKIAFAAGVATGLQMARRIMRPSS